MLENLLWNVIKNTSEKITETNCEDGGLITATFGDPKDFDKIPNMNKDELLD